MDLLDRLFTHYRLQNAGHFASLRNATIFLMSSRAISERAMKSKGTSYGLSSCHALIAKRSRVSTPGQRLSQGAHDHLQQAGQIAARFDPTVLAGLGKEDLACFPFA